MSDAALPATIPLPEVIKGIETLRLHECGSSNRTVADLYDAVLHHLRAGRKECICESFKEAQELGTDNERWGAAVCKMEDVEPPFLRIGHGMPAICFCPWCGGKVVPTAQEASESC